MELVLFFGAGLPADALEWTDFDGCFGGAAVDGLEEDADWAPAKNDPGAKKKNVSATTETANLRTAPPTPESWVP